MRRQCTSSCLEPVEKRFKMTSLNENVVENIRTNSYPMETLTIRGYQTELLEQAKLENLIVCLPTGSGKTYIAVMLIKDMATSIRSSLKDGGKRTIFLVKTVQLVEQQSNYIKTHTDLLVGCYYGDLGVDLWDKEKWDKEFEEHHVLVFTAQVFLNLIDHNFFSLNRVNLIIFDECHHATGDDQYAALMNKHYDQCSEKPRVLGLTASISNKKIQIKNLPNISKELEKTYRARIESGSRRSESIQHGTSVQVEQILYTSYRDEVLNYHESLTIPFDFLRSMVNEMENFINRYKHKQKQLESDLSTTMITTDYHGQNLVVYQKQSSEYTILVQSPINMLLHFKRYIDNLIEVGYELGLAGLFFFAKDLHKRLGIIQEYLLINNSKINEIFKDIFQRLECLVDDILSPLYLNYLSQPTILCSSKVLKLLERIIDQHQLQNDETKCIVFVERVYTATILSRVLSKIIPARGQPWSTRLKVKHVTGIKSIFGDAPMTAKYQKQTIKEFRTGAINILIATAVVEEGLDIPTCDLVIRFNKPHNFSSYMQSKGRARAKKNASYVLFMEKTPELVLRDQKEYNDYDDLERMIQRGCFRDDNEEIFDDDLKRIPAYRPSANIVIDASRAAQLIMEYCVLLGNGQLFPPRFLFHGLGSPYKCILSMPANCPIRDDITCEREKKKLAKYECCLEMVKRLHQKGEFNEYCLPNRHRTVITIEISIENKIFKLVDELFENKTDSSLERFAKQIVTFPVKSKEKTAHWYLYKINSELGFVIPKIIDKLPKFSLYNPQEIIHIEYIKSIACHQLDEFSSYLFEHVFNDMNIPNLLKFDMKNSSFQLYPCLLTRSNEIDYLRMKSICSRRRQTIENYSKLDENEVYTLITSNIENSLYKFDRSSSIIYGYNPWIHKKPIETIQTYDDYFNYKYEQIPIGRNTRLVSLYSYKKPIINYSQELFSKKKDDKVKEILYYPIEYLRYAPLNQYDYQLIYKLPTIFYRLSQLYRIEKLRKFIADKMNIYFCLDVDQLPIVTFQDCLKSNKNPFLLPLIPLTYEYSCSNCQPSTDILFQATTRRSTGECTDMENLEILGDCFLKLTVSLSLYHEYPLANAGALTAAKAKQISNGNLYRIAVQKRLKSYLNAIKNDFRGEQANWIPPGYCLVTQDKDIINRYTSQNVKRKAFADMIEGLIGAYLVSTDYSRTIQFMSWLGLDVIPEKKTIPSIVCASIDEGQIEQVLRNFYSEQNFSQVEQVINYQFENKAYLIAAFTHPSSFANRLTSCYERLEFLGDAVLDFLVTRHVFVENKDITPGLVTDIRQDLSNNGRLAYLLVAYHLHQKILHNSPDLFGKISEYADDEELFPKNDDLMETELNKDIGQWADSTAPKALADVFEALVGAIFLDSGKCLATVWKVIEPLLRDYLHRSIHDPNLNPVRTFFEHGGKIVTEGTEKDPKTKKTTSICVIEAKNGYYIRGCGTNRKMAKFDACRKALEILFLI